MHKSVLENISSPDDLILEGRRVFLRKVRIEDVNEHYFRWMNDPEVNRYMETRFRPQSMDDIRSYVQEMYTNPNAIFMAIVYKGENRHIGNIKLGPISRIHRRGEISFFIGEKRLWGSGLATDAVGLLTDYGLRKQGLVKISAGAYANNTSSIRVFEKLGYVKEGILRSHYFCEGEMVDRVCFAKFRDQVLQS